MYIFAVIMKTELILIGKTNSKHFQAGIDDYSERITHYMPFSIITLPDIKNSKSLTETLIKEKEGEQILKNIQPSDCLVLLDEHGKEHRSVDFAKWLEGKQLSDSVYKRANEMVSLSKMTFSHQMVRLIFTEQLYRACTIMKGEPYHHE